MSNSYRKTPKRGIGSGSDKDDKRRANRRLRRKSKEAVEKDKELPKKREVSDVWDFSKDGKRYESFDQFLEYYRRTEPLTSKRQKELKLLWQKWYKNK